jgi:hypothetical protein
VSNNSAPNLIRDRCIVVFKTTSDKDGEHWWSLDKNADYIVLQRSRDKDAVTNKLKGKARKDVKFSIENLVEKGSIKKLLTILWIHQVMEEFNPNKSSNSQSFVDFVREPIKKTGDESNLAHQSDGKPVTLEIIQTLVSGICKWHPLFLPIFLGNTKLYDSISEITKFNDFNDEDSTLNLAIRFSNDGHSPLHLAAEISNTEMIDLLLEAQKQSQGKDGINSLVNRVGMTALHCAAMASNEITAKHLIEKGADPNRQDNFGRTPLHLAAFFAKDINIVNVLLNDKPVDVHSLDNCGQNALSYAECNQHGLAKEIASRLEESGLITKRTSSNNTSVLDLLNQYSNKELGLSLLPARMESDGSERMKQLDDPHCTTLLQPQASLSKFSSKSTSFVDFFFSFLYFSPFLKTSSITHALLILLSLVSLLSMLLSSRSHH